MTGKPLTGQRILVVEDEMLILLTVEGILEDLGCEAVSAAMNIDQALAFLAGQTFDAAMLDVNLGGEKSYPVADALVALGIPFVFSTGYRGQSLDNGYQDRPVLGKPYLRADLVEMFTALLHEKLPYRGTAPIDARAN